MPKYQRIGKFEGERLAIEGALQSFEEHLDALSKQVERNNNRFNQIATLLTLILNSKRKYIMVEQIIDVLEKFMLEEYGEIETTKPTLQSEDEFENPKIKANMSVKSDDIIGKQ